MNNFRLIIGIILLISAVGMFFYVEDIKDDKSGLFGTATLENIAQMCNAGWGDVFNLTGQCMKVQLFYYSPWILGFFGVVFLAKAGPYRGYSGYGGRGSHNRPRIRPKTKKILIIIISVSIVAVVSVYGYANYDITIANQKIDDIIPPETLEKAFEEISKNMPVKIEERP